MTKSTKPNRTDSLATDTTAAAPTDGPDSLPARGWYVIAGVAGGGLNDGGPALLEVRRIPVQYFRLREPRAKVDDLVGVVTPVFDDSGAELRRKVAGYRVHFAMQDVQHEDADDNNSAEERMRENLGIRWCDLREETRRSATNRASTIIRMAVDGLVAELGEGSPDAIRFRQGLQEFSGETVTDDDGFDSIPF